MLATPRKRMEKIIAEVMIIVIFLLMEFLGREKSLLSLLQNVIIEKKSPKNMAIYENETTFEKNL
jgi:hypothetical protein